jgi:DNA-binding response OmpR family regulator
VTDSGTTETSATVLVVSRDPEILDEARFGFPEDVRVDIADDARTAWAKLQDLVPSVAVVDLHAGSAGGFSLVREMAETDRLRSVPIVMLLDREQDSWLARQAGADAIKVKPLEAGDLVATAIELSATGNLRDPVFPR